MIVAACIPYFDEPVEWLVTQLAMLARCGVELVVHADGAFEHQPTSTRSHLSRGDTHATLAAAAHSMSVSHVHVKPRATWPSEMDKRNVLLQIARPVDWILMIDADEMPTAPVDLPTMLAGAHPAATAASFELVTTPTGGAQDRTSKTRVARLLRGALDLRVQHAHYHYVTGSAATTCNVTCDELGRSRGEQDGHVWHPPHPLQCEHLKQLRSNERKHHNRQYADRRATLGIELAPPPKGTPA
jgi:hypothetical protein